MVYTHTKFLSNIGADLEFSQLKKNTEMPGTPNIANVLYSEKNLSAKCEILGSAKRKNYKILMV